MKVLRAGLHPDGMARRIVNLSEWRAHLLSRQVAITSDAQLAVLYEELRAYPCEQPKAEADIPGPGGLVVPHPSPVAHRSRR